jgi:hypothetical protein
MAAPRGVVYDYAFDEQKELLEKDVVRLDEIIRGAEWRIATHSESCPQIPGTILRVAFTDTFPDAPAMRIFFSITCDRQCTAHWIEYADSGHTDDFIDDETYLSSGVMLGCEGANPVLRRGEYVLYRLSVGGWFAILSLGGSAMAMNKFCLNKETASFAQPRENSKKESMENFAELMQSLLEIQSGGRQRTPERVGEDERLTDRPEKRILPESPHNR